MRSSSRPLGPAALLLGLLIWTSCSELPTAPPTDWGPNFGHGIGVVNGATFADIVPTDLGTLGGTLSIGYDVNDARWVVGTAFGASGQHAFLKRPGLEMEGLQAGPGSTAYAVNNNGQVVGGPGRGAAFLWTDGAALVDLEVAGCPSCPSQAFGLNDGDAVVVVGVITNSNFTSSAVFWNTSLSSGTSSREFAHGRNGTANDINNAGPLNEGRTVGRTTRFAVPSPDPRFQAGLWANLSVGAVLRGPLPSPFDFKSEATAINDNAPAQIVGWSQRADGLRIPFIHLGGPDDVPQALALAGFLGGEAQDINDDQVVVGWVITTVGKRAAVWPSPMAEPILLRGPVDNPAGITEARGINMHCDVVGTITTAAGDSHAALWEVGGCGGDAGEPGTVVGLDGGNVEVVDGTGTVKGTVNIPAGALSSNTVIQAVIIDEADCVNVDGAEGPCVEITIPSGTVINDGFAFVVGICLADPGSTLGFAVFRTDDDGTVVLRSVPVESDCSEGSLGGETGKFSNFQYGPQMFVAEARVKNKRRARKDEIEIKGTFDFAGGGFDPATEDVTITFGECEDPSACTNVELFIAGRDFERKGRRKFEFESEDGEREIEVEIRRNGRYKIKVKGMEVDGIDLEFVSFMFQIGDQTQGVGLEFNNRGRCVRANGSPGCGNDDDDDDDDEDDDDEDDDDDDDDDDDHKKKKRRGRH